MTMGSVGRLVANLALSTLHLISLPDITHRTKRLEILQHRLAALRPGHDVVDMQRHAGILARPRAAHPAEAIVADQHGGAQAPVDRPFAAARAGVTLSVFADRERASAPAAGDEAGEGAQALVPGAEPLLVGRERETRAVGRGHLPPGRLASERAPDEAEVL